MAEDSDANRARRRFGSLVSMRPLPLRFRHGDPPPGWFGKLVHMWRYGISHPDEDLLGVIDAAADSLLTQIMSAEAELSGTRLEKLRDVRRELDQELSDDVPELAVLLGIEAKINALYPPRIQRRRAWMIRERFERVASGHAAEYWAVERVAVDLSEEHGDRLRRADASVAQAAAAAASAAGMLTAAEQRAAEAEAAETEARTAVAGTDDEVAAQVDQLRQLRETAAEDDAERVRLTGSVGALLDAQTEAASAAAARDAATADKALADWRAEAARLDRDLVSARCDFESAQNRLTGAERAAREGRAGGGAAGAQQVIENARSEVESARARVDAAATAVHTHAAAAPAGAEPATEAIEEESESVQPDQARASAAAGGGGDGGGGGGTPPPTGGAANGTGGGIPPDADAQTLLGYIHSSYLMSIAREKAVRDLMRWLMMRFWSANFILLAILLAVWVIVERSGSELRSLIGLALGLCVVAAIGRVGATMSVVQRLQRGVTGNVLAQDPILDLTRLRTGKNGINLALFSGAVFALLMYAFFASGIPTQLGFDDGVAPALASVQEVEQREAEQRVRAENIARSAAAAAEQAERVRDLEQRVQATDEPDGATGGSDQGNETAPANGVAASDEDEAQLRDQLDEERLRLEERQRSTVELASTETSGADQAAPDSTEAPPADAATTDVPANASVDSNGIADEPLPANAQANAVAGDNVQATDGNGQADADGPKTPEGSAAADAEDEQCNAKDDCDPFVRLAAALGLAEREDFFKLLIWAFLAGFAERLVPDALDTIASRTGRRRRRQEGDGEETA
ncbi:MAG TPA: hypothetical protein VF603_01255 [Allosphingosinicella sp.]